MRLVFRRLLARRALDLRQRDVRDSRLLDPLEDVGGELVAHFRIFGQHLEDAVFVDHVIIDHWCTVRVKGVLEMSDPVTVLTQVRQRTTAHDVSDAVHLGQACTERIVGGLGDTVHPDVTGVDLVGQRRHTQNGSQAVAQRDTLLEEGELGLVFSQPLGITLAATRGHLQRLVRRDLRTIHEAHASKVDQHFINVLALVRIGHAWLTQWVAVWVHGASQTPQHLLVVTAANDLQQFVHGLAGLERVVHRDHVFQRESHVGFNRVDFHSREHHAVRGTTEVHLLHAGLLFEVQQGLDGRCTEGDPQASVPQRNLDHRTLTEGGTDRHDRVFHVGRLDLTSTQFGFVVQHGVLPVACFVNTVEVQVLPHGRQAAGQVDQTTVFRREGLSLFFAEFVQTTVFHDQTHLVHADFQCDQRWATWVESLTLEHRIRHGDVKVRGVELIPQSFDFHGDFRCLCFLRFFSSGRCLLGRLSKRVSRGIYVWDQVGRIQLYLVHSFVLGFLVVAHVSALFTPSSFRNEPDQRSDPSAHRNGE
ncbi:hypothetical protein D3C84_347100 [compost metagenome]